MEQQSNGFGDDLPQQPNPGPPEAVFEQLETVAEGSGSLLPEHERPLYFFAYDVLLDHEYLARYVKGMIPFKVARLVHHRLSFPYFSIPQESGLPSIERTNDENDGVWGVIFDARREHGTDKRDFAPLERHLAVPNRYHRRRVAVHDRGGRRYPAFTYALTLADAAPSRPSRTYLERWLDCALERKLPEDWVALLRGLPTLD